MQVDGICVNGVWGFYSVCILRWIGLQRGHLCYTFYVPDEPVFARTNDLNSSPRDVHFRLSRRRDPDIKMDHRIL